jgi:hypothetical protein
MVSVGEYWRENDPRYDVTGERIVRVERIEGDCAFIFHVDTKKITKAKLSRFNGKRGGYSRVATPEKKHD